MPFNSPIVAGEVLIRAAIESENFSIVEPGTGWQISRDGSATYNNLTTRGNASGPVAAYDIVAAGTSLTYQGNELQDLLDDKAGGVIAYHGRETSSVLAAHNVEAAFMRLTVTIPPQTFTEIILTGSFYTNGGARAVADLYIRHTVNGANPTFASAILQGIAIEVPAGGIPIAYTIVRPYYNPDLVPRTLRMLHSFKPGIGGQSGNLYAAPTWPATWHVNQITSALPLTGADDNGASTPPKVFKEFFIGAYDSRSYEGDGTPLQSAGSQFMYSGDIGVDGNRRSACWFDYGTVADMIGVPLVDITYCDVYFFYDHWYFSSGGNAFIGFHESATVTDSQPAGFSPQHILQSWEGRDIGKWVSILGNATMMDAIFDGRFRGAVLGATPSSNLIDYGYAYGWNGNNGNRPHIRAGYYK